MAPKDQRRPSEVSNASTVLDKQNPIRAPLSVYIIFVVVVMTTLVGGIVGFLTISKSRQSINDITSQISASLLEKTTDTVNATLLSARNILLVKMQDPYFARFLANSSLDVEVIQYPEILSLLYSSASAGGTLDGMALFFRPNADGRATGASVSAPRGEMTIAAPSVNYQVQVRRILGVRNDYTLNISSTGVIVRQGFNPSIVYWPLGKNGNVPGRPFLAAISYSPALQSFVVPLIQPVWRGLPVGVVGPGDYWAACGIILTLRTISNFLQTVQISPNGIVAIIEGDTGLMVSTSAVNATQNLTSFGRFPAIGNPNWLISAAAESVASRFGNGTVPGIKTDVQKFDFSFPAGGDDILVNAQWMIDEPFGLKWLVLVIVPSNDFLASIKTSINQTIISVVCICAGSMIAAIFLSWAITAPLLKLVQAMREATKFDFSSLSEGYLAER
ncbi:hypothetical protein HDU96_007588 [Phlyctochytrium bullatum]|nr:hypothetical protein HDU96_007588 [Phlyctochytrium bullatum]